MLFLTNDNMDNIFHNSNKKIIKLLFYILILKNRHVDITDIKTYVIDLHVMSIKEKLQPEGTLNFVD